MEERVFFLSLLLSRAREKERDQILIKILRLRDYARYRARRAREIRMKARDSSGTNCIDTAGIIR